MDIHCGVIVGWVKYDLRDDNSCFRKPRAGFKLCGKCLQLILFVTHTFGQLVARHNFKGSPIEKALTCEGRLESS